MGMEYAWFNNVETKPGIGYPDHWEDQNRWKGGWVIDKARLRPVMGNKKMIGLNIFGNPFLPQIDDYYEPFTFNYSILHNSSRYVTPPSARPFSIITGKPMEKIEKGPNWEDNLGGEYAKRSSESNLSNMADKAYGEFENSFMLYLPRLCEHCLNPTCVAACPSGAIYKREEDGIVLIDQNRCRGWRACVSACPYKKVYFNWKTQRSEKCILCYPKIEAGQPTLCSESCVGRMRYTGVILYDAEKIKDAALTTDKSNLYQAHLDVFLNPNDPEIYREALEQGIPESFLQAAKKSPVYKLVVDWKIAFPLHPEFRTLPMVWYIPPMSPIKSEIESGKTGVNGILPDTDFMKIPIEYMANMFTAGDQTPVYSALQKMLSLRAFMRARTLDGTVNEKVLEGLDVSPAQVEEMYRYLGISDFNDRNVIPSSHKEFDSNVFGTKSDEGFTDEKGIGKTRKSRNLFGGM
jgi:nitrate reductase beta subunit